MRLLSVTLPANHDLSLISDTHYGTLLRHDDGISTAVEMIGSGKNTWSCFLGDALEGIVIDDKRYDCETVDKDMAEPLKQAERVIRDFEAVKKKFLVWMLGNHEMKLLKFGNLARGIAERLGVPYGTYVSVLSVHDKHGLMYRIYLAHGFGAINSNLTDPFEREHSMQRTLKRKLFLKMGHCQIMAAGDSHKLLVKPPMPELYMNGDNYLKQHYTNPKMYNNEYIHPDLRWYVSTGSFLKLYSDDGQTSSYSERGGYNPNILGFPIVEVRDREIVNIRPVIL